MNRTFQQTHEPKFHEVPVQTSKPDLKTLEEKIDDLSLKIDALYSLVEKLKGTYS